jgi:hypothetical protein
MYTKFQHTCGICGHRSRTIDDADAHAWAHETGLIGVAHGDAPLYRLVALNETNERQSDQIGEYADLRALADYCNATASPDCRYAVVFADDALNPDVLEAIAALTADDLRQAAP